MGLSLSLIPFYIIKMNEVDTIKYRRVINNTEYTHIPDEHGDTSSDDDIS